MQEFCSVTVIQNYICVQMRCVYRSRTVSQMNAEMQDQVCCRRRHHSCLAVSCSQFAAPSHCYARHQQLIGQTQANSVKGLDVTQPVAAGLGLPLDWPTDQPLYTALLHLTLSSTMTSESLACYLTAATTENTGWVMMLLTNTALSYYFPATYATVCQYVQCNSPVGC